MAKIDINSHSFTAEIHSILKSHFGAYGEAVFSASPLIGYINLIVADKFGENVTDEMMTQIVTEFENATKIVKKVKEVEVGDKIKLDVGQYSYVREICTGPSFKGYVILNVHGGSYCKIDDLVLASNHYRYAHQE